MRVVVIWLVFATGLAALAGAGVKGVVDGVVVCAAVFSFAVAVGACSSTALGALRNNTVVLADDAPPWRPWRSAILPVVVAVAVGAAVAAAVDGHTRGVASTLWWSSIAAVVVARALCRLPARVSRARIPYWRQVLLEGALPSALVAGGVGVVVGHVRFGAVDVVAPGALARTLAGTGLCYLLLGMGGFIKAFQEAEKGFVDVDRAPLWHVPGPFLIGLAFAALCALVGPWVLPALPGSDVVVWKGVVGVVVGGALSLLGAINGHRRAVSGGS